jgi:hypothetical protein
MGYRLFAIRDFHDNVRMSARPIEIIPVDSVYLEGPPHGFNLFATKDTTIVEHLDLRIVRGVSPKLLADRDPALHHPLDGLPGASSPCSVAPGTSVPDCAAGCRHIPSRSGHPDGESLFPGITWDT